REIIIGETPIIISGPDTLIFIPDTIIGGTPAIISGSEIFISVTLILISVPQIVISGRTLDSRNQPVADMPREISISVTEILISAAVKTAGAAPAGLFPIASQPSTNRLAFVLTAEVRQEVNHESTSPGCSRVQTLRPACPRWFASRLGLGSRSN